ncbi:hypothetical protein EJ06DRAFT_551468 [Trichodelitschia bisporula]|uniref:LysM domain-containing protein n=1 Tax=Trichodelitschia bisporula TaxID=703511 RepID=A0A6G1HLX8_9PEZI|nr:hypothetical protein EJ06DRAFT_551468 [Trichodelitschia bisporula]
MLSSALISLLAILGSACALNIQPRQATNTTSLTPGPTSAPGAIPTCNAFYTVVRGDSCWQISHDRGIPLDVFESWNPQLNANCFLVPDHVVCIGVPGYTPPVPVGPQPQLPGIPASCKKYYLVQAGDGCFNIAAANRISLDAFYALNPGLGGKCDQLLVGYYYCVEG